MKILKRLVIMLVLAFCFIGFVGCKKDEKPTGEKKFEIGILQLVTHGALDAARNGFIEGLKEAGLEEGKNITITVKNPEADPTTMQQMATELVRKCDLVLGIATDAAIALQTAAENEGKDLPILFTAVTDAVEANLVDSNEKPGHNVTGTSDINPVEAQIDLLKELLPEAKKFGIVYNIAEVNSKVQANAASAQATKDGLECIVKTVSEASELGSAISNLLSLGIEALYLPTDNLVAKNITVVVQACEEAKIPTICGEGSMVDAGGTITYGVNYTNLGKQTAVMAKKILLDGVKPADIPVESQPNEALDISVNEEGLAAIGLTLPESIRSKMNK